MAFAFARSPLPVDDILPELLAALGARANVVLEAPPGAGKTTRVPPALLDSGLAANGRVVVLEPRRVAARAAARRIAEERGWSVGREVGWQIRFERKFDRDTRLLFLTEGVLVRRLQSDPYLDGIAAVVFDEFHERSLFADLSLALTRRVQRDARPDLRLIAMSATLDLAPLATFLDAPVVRCTGRLFPVSIEYLERPEPDTALETLVARGIRGGIDSTAGDLLVFLPGVAEIRRAEAALAPLARERGVDIVTLYGDLPGDEQDRVLRPAARRRIILATNVAETSVTLDGVTGVIDSGLVKELAADPASGLERLSTIRISRASAEQRAGRAGRQAPGWCLRLWSEHEQRGLQDRSRPEIRRADLAWAALQLHAWGENDLVRFPWFEAPEPAALERSEATLRALGALDSESGAITVLGRRIAELPLHPRLARLALEGEALGVGDAAALVAALLSERDTQRGALRAPGPGSSESDLLDALDALHSAPSSGGSSAVFRSRDQIRDIVRPRAGRARATNPRPGSPDERLRRAIAAAFLDRLCRRREPGSDRAVMVGGRGVRLARESAVRQAELFVAVELDDREGIRSEALVRRASAVEPAWLPEERTSHGTELCFDASRERVVAVRRTRFENLVLEEKEIPIPDRGEASALLAERSAARLDRVLPQDDAEWEELVARLRFLHRHCPELELPAIDAPRFAELLSPLSIDARSFEELRGAPWRETLLGTLSHAQRTALGREAPAELEVPSGSRIRVDYSDPARPVLAARIQELFGLGETPRLARGRVPVLLHLLAPNGRPQQVTDDLASFWNRTYPEVRKELAGRYPKHAWPLDPWSAQAERRPKRQPR